jgi:hypothetical protein
LGKRFQRRGFFRNQPIRNKNCLWRRCLLMDRNKMSNLYKGPSIDSFYQISVHLAEGFQRRRLKCEKLTDDKWWQRWAKKGEGSSSRFIKSIFYWSIEITVYKFFWSHFTNICNPM